MGEDLDLSPGILRSEQLGSVLSSLGFMSGNEAEFGNSNLLSWIIGSVRQRHNCNVAGVAGLYALVIVRHHRG